MKQALILFVFLLSTAFQVVPRASAQGETSLNAQETQAILVKLSHFTDDLHSASMALKLSALLAEKAHVTLFLNLEGARLADRRASLDLRWGSGGPLSALLKHAQKAGVKIVVCPHCAKAAGIKTKHLRKGMTMGDKDSLASMILNADKILDY